MQTMGRCYNVHTGMSGVHQYLINVYTGSMVRPDSLKHMRFNHSNDLSISDCCYSHFRRETHEECSWKTHDRAALVLVFQVANWELHLAN